MWGPSWALWDVRQHPCPLPTCCQYTSPPPAVIIKTLHMLINVPVENHCPSLSCSPSGFSLILPELFQIPSCPGSLRSSSPEAPLSLKQSPTPTRKALRTVYTLLSPTSVRGCHLMYLWVPSTRLGTSEVTAEPFLLNRNLI